MANAIELSYLCSVDIVHAIWSDLDWAVWGRAQERIVIFIIWGKQNREVPWVPCRRWDRIPTSKQQNLIGTDSNLLDKTRSPKRKKRDHLLKYCTGYQIHSPIPHNCCTTSLALIMFWFCCLQFQKFMLTGNKSCQLFHVIKSVKNNSYFVMRFKELLGCIRCQRLTCSWSRDNYFWSVLLIVVLSKSESTNDRNSKYLIDKAIFWVWKGVCFSDERMGEIKAGRLQYEEEDWASSKERVFILTAICIT